MRGYSEAAEAAWLDRQIDEHTSEPEAEPDDFEEPDERQPDEKPIIHTYRP